VAREKFPRRGWFCKEAIPPADKGWSLGGGLSFSTRTGVPKVRLKLKWPGVNFEKHRSCQSKLVVRENRKNANKATEGCFRGEEPGNLR